MNKGTGLFVVAAAALALGFTGGTAQAQDFGDFGQGCANKELPGRRTSGNLWTITAVSKDMQLPPEMGMPSGDIGVYVNCSAQSSYKVSFSGSSKQICVPAGQSAIVSLTPGSRPEPVSETPGC